MNRTRNRIAAAVVLAGAVLGTMTMGSGAAQAAAGDGAAGPAGGLVGMLGIGGGSGGGGDQVSGTVSGNSSVADIGGQTTEQNTSGD
ncbi:hypothetical protein [Streptomyces sp. NPDC048623]|uniref:hypothetical protein n=1 Tax=Streptomyces sp. NPDC048623 TaxID=3155761 RepID=UPI00341356DE